MPDPVDCEAPLDKNFSETVRLLNEQNVPYWVCHGTLLGLVRDGFLIAWDHDIDIAIWEGDVSKDALVRLMAGSGYAVKDYGADYDFIAFTKEGGREVDFNFYRSAPDSDIAYAEWFIPASRLASLIELVAARGHYSGRASWLVRSLYFLSPLANRVAPGMKKAGFMYHSAGYTTPKRLLEDLEIVEVLGEDVTMPSASHAVLEYIYGPTWRVPNPRYKWVAESPSTRVSRSRFESGD
jgi:hypothetical protein